MLWEGDLSPLDLTLPGVSGKKYLLFDFAIDGSYSGTGVARVAQGTGEACVLSVSGSVLRMSRIVFQLAGDRLTASAAGVNHYDFTLKAGQALVFSDGTYARVTRISAI